MRKMKWIFFGYLAFVGLVIVGIAVAFDAAPPREPGTFYTTTGAAVKSLDPAEVNDTEGSNLLSFMYEGLYNYKYGVEPYELYPELAAAMPAVSPDGLTMTIPLRRGIHFYDPEKAIWKDGVGPELTAADFVYSFKRVCDFNLASGNYSFVFEGHFAGLEEWWKYTQQTATKKIDFDRPVEGFTAPDRYTLRLKFTKPYPQMVYNLVNSVTSPVCRAIVEKYGDNFRQHVVGTGAYAMTENLRDQRIVMTASPTYRGRPDVDGNTPLPGDQRLPKIHRVQMDFFIEQMPVWMMFKQGLFDVNGIPKDAYSSAISGNTGDLTPALAAKGIELNKYSEPSTSYIGINMTDPVLGKNKPLRQAISMAINRQKLIDDFDNGRGLAGIGIVPPGFPTWEPDRINPYTQFDPEKAKQLMVEAERINGGPIPRITLLMRGADTTERQMAEVYTAMLKQIGVTLDPVYRDFARYQQMVDERQMQLFDAGWSADYPDEQDYFQLLYSKNAPAAGLNASVYNNPAFDALYEKTGVMGDTPERRALYVQMQKIVEEDCPWVILSYPKTFALSYDWLGNRKHMDYGHGFTQYVTLDQDLRARRLAGKK